MALIARRHFVRQAAFAAAAYGCPPGAIGESRRIFDADEQNGAPVDAEAIRKLASQIIGRVITPDAFRVRSGTLDFQPRIRSASGADRALRWRDRTSRERLEFAQNQEFATGGARRRP